MGIDAFSRRGALISRQFDDADEFGHSLQAVDVDYLPLSSGPYEARLVALDTGAVLLQYANDQAHIARGIVSDRRGTILIPLQNHSAPVVNGFEVGNTDAVMLVPGAELHSCCPGRQDWAAISFDAADFARLSECARPAACRGSSATMVHLDPERSSALQLFVKAIIDICSLAPRLLESEGLRRSIENELTTRLGSAFAAGATSTSIERRVGRAALRLVRRCDEYLEGSMGQPVYTRDLCGALGVSPRTLHNGFMAACGMSPHAYLKLRRLVLVRRALKASTPEASLVKSVALAHGFWHLGHFSRDYRACFGESPSQTLAGANAARGSMPRPARRGTPVEEAAGA